MWHRTHLALEWLIAKLPEMLRCEWHRTRPALRCLIVMWLVFLHVFFLLTVFCIFGLSRLGQPSERMANLFPFYPDVEMAIVGQTNDGTPSPAAVSIADRDVYFRGLIEACSGPWKLGIAPCVARSDFGFHGAVASTSAYLDEPPTYEEVLFNSYGLYDFDEVPAEILDASAHLVVRGSFDTGTTKCSSHLLLFHQWIFGGEATRTEVPPRASSSEDFTFHHWTCFTEFSVHEYLVGSGPAKISVQHPNSGVPYDTADTPSLSAYEDELESLRSQIAEEYEGIEWVGWLGPSYNATVESLTAYALWDVQKGDDDIVRVVSPNAAYYEDSGVTGSALERLQAPLADFRRDIKAAHESRVSRTSGRVGVGTETPELVSDVFKLPEYYEETGAYDNPIATPVPPPTSPYPPMDLYGELWTDPQPEVDLAWTAPASSQVTTYKIMRVDSLGTEIIVAEIPSEFVEVTDRNLPIAGAEYTYTVIAVNEHGESPPSGTAVIRNGAPNAPTGLYVSLEPGNEADLEWYAPPSSYVTGYRIDRKTGNGAWVTLSDNLPTDYLNSTDWNLQSGTTYTYRVVALNGWSTSAPSAPYVLRVP